MMYPERCWSIATKEKVIYLTFDDGPHTVATSFVLDTLQAHSAKATFFCIGKNVEANQAIYKRILDEGHAVGNHTQNHLNGWKTDNTTYLANVKGATKWIDSALFRPPYGRITSFQAKQIKKVMSSENAKVVMWDVLSADFDEELTGEDCLKNVLLNTKQGSIVVFHDSEKAMKRLQYALPRVLDVFEKKGYRFEKLMNS
jgi:peptidoglycan-N-acetylglucosamine deacetylase